MAKTSPCPRCRENGKDSRGNNLVTFRDGGEHCFACGYHRNPRNGGTLSSGLSGKPVNGPKSLLPIDFTREVPAAAFKWLLQFGLSWSYWKDKVGFSPSETRLYFTLGDPLAGSVGRYVGPQTGPGEGSFRADEKPKWFARGDIHKHCEVVGDKTGKSIVLVEDVVSAHKVGQVTTTIPLFGVNIHPAHFYYLLRDDRPVVLWLDDDQKGRSIMHKAIGIQAVLNRTVSTVTTKKDPKYLSIEEINQEIQ